MSLLSIFPTMIREYNTFFDRLINVFIFILDDASIVIKFILFLFNYCLKTTYNYHTYVIVLQFKTLQLFL